MTPEQFYTLNEKQQAEIVATGKHIGQRQDENYIIMLYKSEGLYIEVFLHKKQQLIKKWQPLPVLDF
jgi:hypothetical protein